MKNILITFTITFFCFVSGILAYQLIANHFRGNHYVSGVVQYHMSDYTLSGDWPEGYFIESSGIDAIYLSHENIGKYLGKRINARGHMDEIHFNDYNKCFPLILIKEIRIVK